MRALQEAGPGDQASTRTLPLPLPVTPSFVVRVAGLPMEVLARLRFERTMRLVDELLDRQDQLRVEGEELSQALYDVIGAVDDPALRGRLIALRRSTYQERPPRRGVLDDDLWAVIPAELAARITAWSQRIAQRDALRARAEATLETEAVDTRRALADAASDEWFQQGLALASQDLYAELVKWLRAGPAARPDAQLEASLVKYLSRAAAKTSPYSTFTSIAEGRWALAGPPVRCARSWTRRSAVELAAQIAKHLRRTLARWPEIKPHLPLRINPSLSLTICVRAPEDGAAESPTNAHQDAPPLQTQGPTTRVGAPEDGAAESPTNAHQDASPLQTQGAARAGGTTLRFLQCRGDEAVVEMAATPTLRRVLEVVRATPTPSYGGTAAAIAALDPTTGTLEVTAYLDRLLDVGLLEAQLDVPDQSLDHLGALLDALAGYSGERIEGIRELLERLRAHLARLADSTQARARLESMGAVDDTLHELYASLGWTQRGIEVPQKKAFLEDTLVVGLEYRCALPDWSGVLDDLRLLHGLTGLYDRSLPTRLALTAFFADHYGAGSAVSFLDFCGVLWDELRRPGRWRPDYRVSGADLAAVLDQAAVLNQPSVTTTAGLDPLDRLKQAQRQVSTHVDSQPVDQTGIRRLNHGLVADLVAALPEFVQPHDSVAFYGQPMIRDGTPSFVLNTTDSGFRRAHSRLQRLVRRTQGGVCSAPGLPTGDGRQALYADVAGIAGSNLNLRISSAPYEITYPGSVSHRPPAERIPLRDLAVTHDPTTDRLRLVWRSRGLEVVPLHLGMMVDHALPRAYRLLIQAFGVSSFCGLPLRLSGFDAITDGRGVRRVPRLCLGNVVVQRATWVVRSDDVPLRAKGESVLAYLIRVTRWIREHDIPQQCFVRAVAAGNTSTALGKNRKPCYVDFSNQVFLRVFQQIAQQPDRLLICQEVLPTNDDLRITDQRGGYASECVFELGR